MIADVSFYTMTKRKVEDGGWYGSQRAAIRNANVHFSRNEQKTAEKKHEKDLT